MNKKEVLYEGKAKKIYQTDKKDILWVEYLNQATALNGLKKDQISGKGRLNNLITSHIFNELHAKGVPNHFIEKLSETEQAIQAMEMFPLEVVIRNVAAGSFTKRFNIPEGTLLEFPILEFYYKNDALDDPFINDEHVKFLAIANQNEITAIKKQAYQINQALIQLFAEVNIQLIDFKIEFGKTKDGQLMLADEISPDTCRLWDLTTGEHLDKDIYRQNLGDIIPVYQEVLNRFEKI